MLCLGLKRPFFQNTSSAGADPMAYPEDPMDDFDLPEPDDPEYGKGGAGDGEDGEEEEEEEEVDPEEANRAIAAKWDELMSTIEPEKAEILNAEFEKETDLNYKYGMLLEVRFLEPRSCLLGD